MQVRISFFFWPCFSLSRARGNSAVDNFSDSLPVLCVAVYVRCGYAFTEFVPMNPVFENHVCLEPGGV